MTTTTSSILGEPIYAYTRLQAIEDGGLVDVSETASEAGFRWPVALTRGVFDRYVEVPDGVALQDESGRLWDIVWMAFVAIRGTRGSASRIPFELYVRNDNRRPKKVLLYMVAGPGDEGEPVVTIMLPKED